MLGCVLGCVKGVGSDGTVCLGVEGCVLGCVRVCVWRERGVRVWERCVGVEGCVRVC